MRRYLELVVVSVLLAAFIGAQTARRAEPPSVDPR
jgi:hypothetical protein